MIKTLPWDVEEKVEILSRCYLVLKRKNYDDFEDFLGGFDYRRHFEATTKLSATVRWKSEFRNESSWYIWKEDDKLRCSKVNDFKAHEEIPYEALTKPDEFPEYYI